MSDELRIASSETYYAKHQEGHSGVTAVAFGIMRLSDGQWYDFDDDTFKASGWVTKHQALTEGDDGLWYYSAGWGPPNTDAVYAIQWKVTDADGTVYNEGPNLRIYTDFTDGLYEASTDKLVSLSDAKNRLGITGSSDDALLVTFIQAVTKMFEKFLDRSLKQEARTEYYDGGGHEIYLRAFPISESPAPSVWEDSDWDYASSDLLDENDDYVVDYVRGRIIRDGDFEEGGKAIKVTYTGGYAESGGVITAPEDIRKLALLQVVHMWRKSKTPGVTTKTTESGTITDEALDLLPIVKRQLTPHKRILSA